MLATGIRVSSMNGFDRHSTEICCSKLQAQHMGLTGDLVPEIRFIPPPVDLEPFEQAAASTNGNRAGAVSVAAWRHPNKGAAAVAEWGQRNSQHVSFYGGGPFAPPGSQQVAYKGMPQLLAHFDRFVFLPTTIEPWLAARSRRLGPLAARLW
jgi:hypothetical protein